MHQPFYKDPVRNSYVMPWAYLHGTKDYLGMAALAGEFPDVHQTFNLVPSLMLQLEEYASEKARDKSFDLAFKPVDELSPDDRAFIVEHFFPVPLRTMLQPYPRYVELHERRSDSRQSFSDQDIRDIQVWWTLVWMDHDRRPADLVVKGRLFSESDKSTLRRLVVKTIGEVAPTYRTMQEKGIIEISTTPFYHPILPILIDSHVDGRVPVDVHFLTMLANNSLEPKPSWRRDSAECRRACGLPRVRSRTMSHSWRRRWVSDGWQPMKAFLRNQEST
jgi:alpha-amylase/alpha-mannosidase (GH57 family)